MQSGFLGCLANILLLSTLFKAVCFYYYHIVVSGPLQIVFHLSYIRLKAIFQSTLLAQDYLENSQKGHEQYHSNLLFFQYDACCIQIHSLLFIIMTLQGYAHGIRRFSLGTWLSIYLKLKNWGRKYGLNVCILFFKNTDADNMNQPE